MEKTAEHKRLQDHLDRSAKRNVMSKFTSKKKKLKTMSKQINKRRKVIFSFKADAAGAVLWIGAMIGASAAFFIGRTLGREFAVSLIGDKLKKYD